MKSSMLRRNNNKVKDVSKRTCFKCDQVGHIGRKCPNLKHVGVERKTSEVLNQKSTKFGSKQTWKPMTPRFRTRQSWKTMVDATKLHQFWKSKIDLTKQNSQSDSQFYQRNGSTGQIWVVKTKSSVNEKNKENIFEKMTEII
ncbi:putative transcription factor interactor and regulator CCHC(Zn) family [Helianthus anomalus]